MEGAHAWARVMKWLWSKGLMDAEALFSETEAESRFKRSFREEMVDFQ